MSNRKTLYHFLLGRLRQPEDAEDLLQDIYLRLRRNDDRDPVSNTSAYLFTLANNLVIDHRRRTGTRRDSVPHIMTLKRHSEARTPEIRASEMQAHDQLRQAMEKMPETRRQVFLMHKFHGYSYREIAEKLGVSTKMIEKHMTKALASCHQCKDAFVSTADIRQ